MKNNRQVDRLQVKRGNESASLMIYETLEIGSWVLLLKVIGRVHGCWTFSKQATRASVF
jgi:hypothetical protein